MNLLRHCVLFMLLPFCMASCTYYLGPNQLTRHFKAVPATNPAVYDYNSSYNAKSDLDKRDSIIDKYAQMAIPEKRTVLDRDLVRIILGKLAEGKDVQQINDFIISLKPWAGHGSTGPFNKLGDYDFTEITWCSLLYLYGNEPALLYPKTRDHLVNVLIENSGAKPSLRMPGTARLFRETENHILMGEVSRYLKNQWLFEHGDTSLAYNNARNGLEKWMLNHLDEKFRGGFYEFNSNPYSGYSFQALNTLFSFTHSDTVRHAVNKVLNELMFEFALSSNNLTRYPPYRRQPHRASYKGFDWDPLSSIVRVLVARKTGGYFPIHEKQHGLITKLLHYSLTDELLNLLEHKNTGYFAMLGHGRKGSPEIYTGGAGFVLSAGGVQRGAISQLAARPTLLILNDHVSNTDSCFSLCSKGKMQHWNNTGVYDGFACANQPVHIPPQYKAVKDSGNWQLFYSAASKLNIVTYSEKKLGLLLVVPGNESLVTFNQLIADNKTFNLQHKIRIPSGLISYRTNSSKNKWVITRYMDVKLPRHFDKWQRLNVRTNTNNQQ